MAASCACPPLSAEERALVDKLFAELESAPPEARFEVRRLKDGRFELYRVRREMLDGRGARAEHRR